MLVELQHRTRPVRRALHGGEFVQGFGGGNNAARVHGAVTWQAVDLIAESNPAIPERLAARADAATQQRPPTRIGGELRADDRGIVRLEFARAFVHERFGEPERKANVARGGARAVGDEGADERHMARTEAFQHRVNHLITPIRSKVHIHIRIRLASFIEKALEDQVVADGIHTGDPEQIRNHRIARTPATLRGDPILVRVAHDLRTEEKELGEPRAFNGGELTRNAPR